MNRKTIPGSMLYNTALSTIVKLMCESIEVSDEWHAEDLSRLTTV